MIFGDVRLDDAIEQTDWKEDIMCMYMYIYHVQPELRI